MWTCCGGSKPGSCIVLECRWVQSLLTCLPTQVSSVQHLTLFIYVLTVVLVNTQQLSLAKYVSDYFYISYLFDLLTHKHISVSFLLTQVIK